MTLQTASSAPSANLHAPNLYPQLAPAEPTPWRKILAVEPDIAVLHAKSRLLADSNFTVTPATCDRDLFSLRGTKAFALAILSDRLGLRLLGNVARIVRRHWPRTRILIMGEVPPQLEDHLYDEQIDRASDSQQTLAALEKLYEGMWNRRSNTLDWDATRTARCAPWPLLSESDPTKTSRPTPTSDNTLRGTPSDLRIPLTRPTYPAHMAFGKLS